MADMEALAAGLASKMADRGTPVSEGRTANFARLSKEVKSKLLESDSGVFLGRHFCDILQPLVESAHTYTLPQTVSYQTASVTGAPGGFEMRAELNAVKQFRQSLTGSATVQQLLQHLAAWLATRQTVWEDSAKEKAKALQHKAHSLYSTGDGFSASHRLIFKRRMSFLLERHVAPTYKLCVCNQFMTNYSLSAGAINSVTDNCWEQLNVIPKV